MTRRLLSGVPPGVAFEAGMDFLVGGHFVIGLHGGAIARDGYSSQGSFGVNLGWAFGGGG